MMSTSMENPDMAYGVPAINVVGGDFCVPYPVNLNVKKKTVGLLSDANTYVLDINGNRLLQISGSLWQLQKKRIMRDPAGFPILTMREKAFSSRHRWTVHRGESSDSSNLLYVVQRTHALQFKTRLDVFIAGNESNICNFHVVGSSSSQSFRVYNGDTLIAEVTDNFNFGNFFRAGEEAFGVRVNAGVDYAFIVSLLVILNENDIF